MKKDIYEVAELEIIRFSIVDVLVGSSGGVEDDDEGPFVPKH